MNPWIVCQIGAREHYAIPRAMQRQDRLDCVITDAWCPPGHWIGRLPKLGKLRDRWSPELSGSTIHHCTGRMVVTEFSNRIKRTPLWPTILRNNRVFSQYAAKCLERISSNERTLFSYSYAAKDLIPVAHAKGWPVVIGQIDPGPEEERIVAEEHERYPEVESRWTPAPAQYWKDWQTEVEKADHVMVNSPWSAECLAQTGVASDKIEIVPLAYQSDRPGPAVGGQTPGTGSQTTPFPGLSGRRAAGGPGPFEVLFLGQINLRKGIARLVEAMRILQSEQSIRLTLAGPSEVSPELWADCKNIRWVGPVLRSETPSVYSQADVFILPTLSDGYALTQLEALAQGVPVIASKQCGQAVTPNQNGWILKDTHPETIAETIRRAADERCLMSTPEAIGGFSIDQLASTLTDLYR